MEIECAGECILQMWSGWDIIGGVRGMDVGHVCAVRLVVYSVRCCVFKHGMIDVGVVVGL